MEKKETIDDILYSSRMSSQPWHRNKCLYMSELPEISIIQKHNTVLCPVQNSVACGIKVACTYFKHHKV